MKWHGEGETGPTETENRYQPLWKKWLPFHRILLYSKISNYRLPQSLGLSFSECQWKHQSFTIVFFQHCVFINGIYHVKDFGFPLLHMFHKRRVLCYFFGFGLNNLWSLVHLHLENIDFQTHQFMSTLWQVISEEISQLLSVVWIFMHYYLELLPKLFIEFLVVVQSCPLRSLWTIPWISWLDFWRWPCESYSAAASHVSTVVHDKHIEFYVVPLLSVLEQMK